MTLPAHQTKATPLLDCTINGYKFQLVQMDDNGETTGTTLWLGAQCLSLYLLDIYKTNSKKAKPRAIELGSGIGLTALTLASIGWEVFATDTGPVIASVLQPNVDKNAHLLPGNIQVLELDWHSTTDMSSWGPFDLLITSDTIYSGSLTQPLLRNISAINNISLTSRPAIYVCLERRDPALVDEALNQAREDFNFQLIRIPERKLAKCLKVLDWEKSDWEGVELWRFKSK